MKHFLRIISISLGFCLLGIATYLLEPYYYHQRLNRPILDVSLHLGKQFLLNNQYKEGNFTYEYDFINRKYPKGDSQVRQAGALWGVSLIHHDNPTPGTFKTVKKGLKFFNQHSKPAKGNNGRFIKYPRNRRGSTGTVALTALACIEMLQTPMDSADKAYFKESLDNYIKFLLSLRTKDGRFAGYYETKQGRKTGKPSQYFDGETLLALSRAANYLGYDTLKPIILESAEAMYQKYVVEAREKEKDSPVTKGFYQWGSMAFYEIYSAGWGDKYTQRIIDMAYWMIDTHRTLWRTKNTAYAHEGIITAYQTAKLTGNKRAMKKFAHAVDKALIKLSSWQVGGPLQNRYLSKHPTQDKNAIGGIMNCKDCPVLRIDVTQHQMHALILARKYIYKE